MGLKLPLELELYIMDLALPPRTSANYHARLEILLAYALVHRSWTAHARRRLCGHARLTLREEQSAMKARVKRILRQVEKSGTVLTRFDLRIRWEAEDGYEFDALPMYECLQLLAGVPELTVARTAGLCEPCDSKMLRQLPPRLSSSPECPFDLRAFSHLRFLGLSHIIMPDGWSISDAPHLEILLIHDVLDFSFSDLNPDENEKKQETELRLVGVKGDGTSLESLTLPSSVEHLALISISTEEYSTLIYEGAQLGHHLQTCTILVSPAWHDFDGDLSDDDDDDYDVEDLEGPDNSAVLDFRQQFETAGTKLTIRRCEREAEVDRFSLEEWPYPVED